ncbi:MAG: tetratricopeptide repeat protein [Anaerolineales bacterium]|nr:tetratricopeptide repeat protein [Anaerolineales bacterium]
MAAFERTKTSKLLALAHNNLGFLALAQGRPEEARARFEASAASDPNAENYRGLAEAESRLGHWDAAQAYAEQSLALAQAAGMAVEEEPRCV